MTGTLTATMTRTMTSSHTATMSATMTATMTRTMTSVRSMRTASHTLRCLAAPVVDTNARRALAPATADPHRDDDAHVFANGDVNRVGDYIGVADSVRVGNGNARLAIVHRHPYSSLDSVVDTNGRRISHKGVNAYSLERPHCARVPYADAHGQGVPHANAHGPQHQVWDRRVDGHAHAHQDAHAHAQGHARHQDAATPLAVLRHQDSVAVRHATTQAPLAVLRHAHADRELHPRSQARLGADCGERADGVTRGSVHAVKVVGPRGWPLATWRMNAS